MERRPELLIFRCREDDAAVIEGVAGPCGASCRPAGSRAEVLHLIVTRRPAGIFLGIGDDAVTDLDVIPMILTVAKKMPVIVVASGDSLDLERSVRQHPVFYYLVHPLDQGEVRAVVDNALRRLRA